MQPAPSALSTPLRAVAHYGLRWVNNYLAADEPKYDPACAAALERLELALRDLRGEEC